MKPIRVLQWGLGAMGSGMARLMLEKSGLQIVAAVDGRPDYVGKDLGEILKIGKTLGVTVTDKPETVLDKDKVDIVVIATTSWVKEQLGDLSRIIKAGMMLTQDSLPDEYFPSQQKMGLIERRRIE